MVAAENTFDKVPAIVGNISFFPDTEWRIQVPFHFDQVAFVQLCFTWGEF